MTESSAEAKYREFETLRKCFGSEQGRRAEPEKECCKPQHFRIRECGAGKRRHDPRANAPPLVPLVEEGDQLDEVTICIMQLAAGGGEGLGLQCRKSVINCRL